MKQVTFAVGLTALGGSILRLMSSLCLWSRRVGIARLLSVLGLMILLGGGSSPSLGSPGQAPGDQAQTPEAARCSPVARGGHGRSPRLQAGRFDEELVNLRRLEWPAGLDSSHLHRLADTARRRAHDGYVRLAAALLLGARAPRRQPDHLDRLGNPRVTFTVSDGVPHGSASCPTALAAYSARRSASSGSVEASVVTRTAMRSSLSATRSPRPRRRAASARRRSARHSPAG
jgi:hypothetical protein